MQIPRECWCNAYFCVWVCLGVIPTPKALLQTWYEILLFAYGLIIPLYNLID